MQKSFVWLLFLSVALVACSRPASSPRVENESFEAQEFARDRQIFRARGEDRGIDVKSYDLKGHFDWKKQRLIAIVDIELTITATQLERIVLDNLTEVKSAQANGANISFNTSGEELTLGAGGKRGDTVKLTLAYEAYANRLPSGDRSALFSVSGRAGDPISARVVATVSEPESAIDWMPCHDVPSDRAKFSVEMTMPENESMIANGDLRRNEVVGTVRTMAYATAYTLPNYLMAFSIGEFARYAGLHGRMPIGIWARKGVPIDVPGVLGNLDRMLSQYEKLVGPYPFEKYAIVLLPDYTGGVENAGISFQGEIDSTRANLIRPYSLTAHELGHQWFGDYVTVRGWDDLWIKEGMATLLAAEALRPFADQSATGELRGEQFSFNEGDAIRDAALDPNRKYTSGPYGRSAWTLTQVRSIVGEKKFWETLRGILKEHAFESVSTDEFLGSFEPVLGKDLTGRWRKALAAKKLPHLSDTKNSMGQHEWKVIDDEGALLVPLEARWLDENENKVELKLAPGQPIAYSESDSRLLILEPRNITPLAELPGFDVSAGLNRLLVPRTERQRSQFPDLPGPAQWYALHYGEGWKLEATAFPGFLRSLANEDAKYEALQEGCNAGEAATSDSSRDAWKKALLPGLKSPPFMGLTNGLSDKGLSHCRATVGDSLLQPVWDGLNANPADLRWNETLLTYAMLISADTATIFRVSSQLAQGAPSVEARRIGLNQLARHLQGILPAPSPSEKTQWVAFLRDQLSRVKVSELVRPILTALKAANDREALPVLASVIGEWRQPSLQRLGLCTAKDLAGTDSAAWDSFRQGLRNTGNFSPDLRRVLTEPGGC